VQKCSDMGCQVGTVRADGSAWSSQPLLPTPGTANAAEPWLMQEKAFKTIRQQLSLLTFSFETAEKWRL